MNDPGKRIVKRKKTVVFAVAILTALSAAMAHQAENRRLRQLNHTSSQMLQAQLNQALDWAAALQDSSVAPPGTSSNGDTLIFYLPGPGAGRIKELRLFVDHKKGGLWLKRADSPPVAVARAVDGFTASIDQTISGQPSIWLELRGRLAQTGNLPVRRHVFRSIPLRRADVMG